MFKGICLSALIIAAHYFVQVWQKLPPRAAVWGAIITIATLLVFVPPEERLEKGKRNE